MTQTDTALIFQGFVTVSQFAKLCRVTRRTVYRWIDAQLAPNHQRGPDARIYFDRAEAEKFAQTWLKKQNSRRKEARKS